MTRITAYFEPELNGLTSYSVGFHSSERNETEKYAGWNFTDHQLWDSRDNGFWYSHETTVLYETVEYIIGEEQIHTLHTKITPQKLTLVGRGEPKSFFLWIPSLPTKYDDKIWLYLEWEKNVQNVNEYG